MLKEIIICIIIVITILIGNFITQDYTKQTVSELTESLSNLKDKLMQENVDDELVKNENEKTYSKWEDSHDKLAYYIEHNELEKIESELTALKSHIETKEHELSVEEIDESIFLLKHVQDRYAFSLENIF